MNTSELQVDKVYFTFKKIRYLSSLLFGAILVGVIMNIFMSHRAFGWGIVVYRDFVYLGVTVIMAFLYYIEVIKLTTALVIISYFILTCYTVVLLLIFNSEDFRFYSYFLEIQFLVMLFGLILTIGVRPYHDLILGAYNLIFSTLCLFYIQEFQIETYLFFVSIVTAKCIICYVIFKRVFLLRKKMKAHTETIIRQNAELLELTNFRKDIIRIIAHDLRSPIHQMSSLLDIVKHSNTDEDREEIMGFLNTSVDNAYSMLENLLKWAMQSDESLKGFSMINVNELVGSVEKQLEKQMHQKNIKVQKHIMKDSEIFYSKNVIESSTRNLLSNAVKFSPTNNTVTIIFDDRDINFSLSIFNKSENTELKNIEEFNKNAKPLKSTNGTANEIGSGNGLLVCRQMLEKNNGSLSLTIEDGGVLATILVTKTL
ncbi:MAG: HAMP domain-containing sensor histidine kinase [Maribacter sp.]